MKKFLFAMFLIPCVVFAEDAVPKAASILDKLSALIPQDGNGLAVVLFILGGVIDIPMRLWKTQKPLDLMIVFSKILFSLGNLCLKVSNLLDKVLPNKSVEPKVK